MMTRAFAPALLIAALGVSLSCNSLRPGSPNQYVDAEASAAFRDTVKPLFEKRCTWCHSNEAPSAGLNFQDLGSLLSVDTRFIVPGKANESRIYLTVVRENGHPGVMPGDGWGITEAQRAALELWLDRGAPWPSGRAGKIRRKQYTIEFDDYL